MRRNYYFHLVWAQPLLFLRRVQKYFEPPTRAITIEIFIITISYLHSGHTSRGGVQFYYLCDCESIYYIAAAIIREMFDGGVGSVDWISSRFYERVWGGALREFGKLMASLTSQLLGRNLDLSSSADHPEKSALTYFGLSSILPLLVKIRLHLS